MIKIYFLIMILFINSVVLSQSQWPEAAAKDWLNSLTDEKGKQIMSNTDQVYNNFMENGTTPDITITGDTAEARLGYSVSSAGDVNGDGFSDIVVGAYYPYSGKGRAYIFLGGVSMNNIADVILTGEEIGDNFGHSVSYAGDVNGDGFSDVIVGAYQYSSDTGRAYIFYGGVSMNNTADVILTGAEISQFGISVSSAGDVNSDGFSDVIVGAFYDLSGIGRAYIFFGSALMNNAADVIMTGQSERFGCSVSYAGDLNGDGYSDVIVGAHRYSSWRGRAYIFFGGASMNNTSDVIMTGRQDFIHFGISVSSAGDVNGDEYSDVIVGEHSFLTNGLAQIYYGGASMDATADVIMTGEAVDDYFGYSVSSAGDVNGDGYSDVIVGAWGRTPGKAYVFFGSELMNNTADVVMTGEATYNFFGYSVSSAGDVNGDGYSDVIVGAWGNSNHTGSAYVYSEGLLEHLNDVGVSSIVQPSLNSIYNFDCINVSTVIPIIRVSNFGSNDQLNNFDVLCEIKQGNNVVYFNSKQDTISGQQSHMLYFDPLIITPYTYEDDLARTYSIKSWTSLSTDVNRYNDTVNSSFKTSNPNYGYSDESGYYVLNSSQAASCIPEQPSYIWEDTTGSISLIVNGQPVIPYTLYNSFYFCGSFRLPDVLPAGRKFKFFGTCYDTIIIANNGVIGFGDASLSRMNVPFPEAIPSVNAPHPAIFPLWYRVNFQDPEITGRNLKYKITNDKFIITYDRAPLYNTVIDANDYVTFQVILETDVDCSSENGKIKVQYNYDKCGSTFINNYNNDGLNEMTVGIQNLTGTIALQYRRSEANHTVTVRGPLFGSPLALEFAPINSVLPIDLQAFTSSVNKNNVTLNWSVNSELNNSGFEIQRRKSESEWIKICFVSGRGTSFETNNYSYEDKNLYTGKYEYRLRQIDYNGGFKYYDLQNEVVIGIPEKFRLAQNYPNPFNPKTKIDFDLAVNSKMSIIVYDVSGREVKKLMNEIKEAGYYSVEFDGANLASGVYFYKLEAGEFLETKRMMLLK